MNPAPPASLRRPASAFTRIELMVVIGIVALLVGLTVPVVTSLSKAGGVNAGGRLISNLLTVARSDAINQRTRVQLRVVTKWVNNGTEDVSAAYRKMSVWRLDPAKQAQTSPPADLYTQVSKWETLPTGIIIDPSPDPSQATPPYTFEPSTSPKYPGTYFLDPDLNNTTANVTIGTAVVDFVWIQFDPSGAANFPGKGFALVTEGYIPAAGSKVVYTQAGHPNWIATSVTGVTGRILTIRP